MIIRSSRRGRRRPAASWHGPFTRGSYGSTDGRVATLPVCVPLSAARPVGCLQQRRGRRRRIPGTDHASGAGGVPLQLRQVRHVAGRRIRSQRERSEEHTSELQSRLHLVCRLLLEKKKKNKIR